MRFAKLILKNVLRNKRRTLLTISSLVVSLFLIISLATILTEFERGSQEANPMRLMARHSVSLGFLLPIGDVQRIQSVQGVKAVTPFTWFGGIYKDEKNFFANFAVDAKKLREIWPEVKMADTEWKAFESDRQGAVVGRKLQILYGFTPGQRITLKSPIYNKDIEFVVRGVYTGLDEKTLFFHHDYLEEKIGRPGIAGWYVVEISDPNNAAGMAKMVDDQFRNSNAPTKTGTEQAFNASFATMWGNVSLLMNTIGMAVVFAILLVTANAMMMSARERTRELAVLKTIGFTDGRLFGLVMLEAGLITITGAAIGLGAAKLLYRATNFNAAGFLPGFDVTTATLLLGGGIALVLMLASGIVPAARAARLPVVAALRNVE